MDLDHKTLSGALNSGLGDGVYTVKWNALTPDDSGHSQGSFTFGVNVNPGAQPTEAPEPTEAPATATQPTAAQPTAQPTATAAPGALPKTADSGPGLGLYLLLGGLVLLACGAVLRQAWGRQR